MVNLMLLQDPSEEFITVSISIKVDEIPKKDGTCRSIYYTLQFIDSLKLSAPSDKLVENSKLVCDDPSENFSILKEILP